MIHDPRSIIIAVAITAAMLVMALGFIAWGVAGMVAL